MAFAQDVSPPSKFIQPIVTMSDVKGDIVYADRKSPFFLIVVGDIFYIGHPTSIREDPKEDVPYTWGHVRNCSTPSISCVRAGAYIFIRSKSERLPVTLYDHTAVTAWADDRGGWYGAGSRYLSPEGLQGSKYNLDVPNFTYQYMANRSGKITRILVKYWSQGDSAPVTHDLKLESKVGFSM